MAGTRPAPTGTCRDRRDVGLRNSFDWTPVTNVDTLSSRHVVGGGGVAGRVPPAQGRADGPTVQNCSGQWLEVSGQRRRLPSVRVGRGPTTA